MYLRTHGLKQWNNLKNELAQRRVFKIGLKHQHKNSNRKSEPFDSLSWEWDQDFEGENHRALD